MRFSIRDLLLVTVIVGLFFAWAMEIRRADALRQQLDQMKQDLASKDVELNRVAEHLQREQSRRRFYQSGTIGYPAYGFAEIPNSSAPTPKLPKE